MGNFSKWVRKLEGLPEPEPKPKPFFPLPDQKVRLGGKAIKAGELSWVASAFTWKDTDQGWIFWYEVQRGAGDQELAVRILKSWKEQLGV